MNNQAAQTMPELKPCPFCGGEAERIDFGPGDAENEGGSCIACKRCQSSGPVEFGYKENFISNWNRRAALTREARRPADDYGAGTSPVHDVARAAGLLAAPQQDGDSPMSTEKNEITANPEGDNARGKCCHGVIGPHCFSPSPCYGLDREVSEDYPQRYYVTERHSGFWGHAVKEGDGEAELFIGHKKQCELVARRLNNAFDLGQHVAATKQHGSSISELPDRWRDFNSQINGNDCADELEAALTREAPTEGVVRDREADRVRYPDKDFNAWLDAGISDAGHTIYDSIGNIADAWQGWFGHVVSVMLDEPEPLFATPTAPQRHPDALEDGSLSKSTAKRVDALRLAQGEDGIIDGVFDEDGALSNWQPWRVFRDDDGYLWLTTDDRERDVEVNDERFAVRYNRPGDLHG